MAEGFKSECRADDIIARVGGDEFVILLPKTDLTAVENLAKRIRETVEQKKVMGINVSVSFGWDTKATGEQPVSELMQNAEDSMYQKKIFESTSRQSAVLKSIMNTLLVKSPREEEHSVRVSNLCESIARAYGLGEDKVNEIKTAGALHDIGKIAVDERVLNKTSRLTREERVQIENHPEMGYRLLSTSSEYIGIAGSVLAHHEWWDGSGYPKGIKGEQIPWMARVIALADAYDAMTSNRPYSTTKSPTEAARGDSAARGHAV